MQTGEQRATSGDNPENHGYKKTTFYTPQAIVEKESGRAVLSDLLLTWTGCYIKAHGHRVDNRVLADYVMIYCVDGAGWLRLNERTWTIRSGDLFICPPDIAHAYGADQEDPWTKYYVHFRGKNAAAYMELLGMSMDAPVLHIGENTRIIAWMQDIFTLLKTGYSSANLLLASACLGQILSYVNSQRLNSGFHQGEDLSVEAVIHYMLDNIDGNLTLEQLSRYAQRSRYYFVRLFREKTGYSPVDYYIRLKMQKACALLEHSSVTVSSISSSLGYASPYYFSNTFKRVIGHSPSQYRSLMRSQG
jgi:AraC-like DNA-binding protein/quercetin dioxygenase-like cupin family protein